MAVALSPKISLAAAVPVQLILNKDKTRRPTVEELKTMREGISANGCGDPAFKP